MAKRSKDWNAGLSEDLKDPLFATEFIMAALDADVLLKTTLAKTIRSLGVKEFAKTIKMAESNLLWVLSEKSNPTQDTYNRLLQPLTVTPIKEKSKKAS